MKVKEILAAKGNRVVTIEKDTMILDAMSIFSANRVGSLIIVDKENNILGIIGARDVLNATIKNHKESFLKINSGICRIISMMKRQNQGVYSVERPLLMALSMSAATCSGVAQMGPFLCAAVMGVSTKPGLMVRTLMPSFESSLRMPSHQVDRADLAEP